MAKKKNKIKNSISGTIFDVCNICFMLALMIIMLYPIVNVFAISVSSSDAIVMGKVSWLPVGFNINSYKTIFLNNEIIVAYKNTILYAVAGTGITLLFTLLAAYPLSVENFVLKKPFNFLLVFTMIFSGGLIPTYLVIRSLNLLDSFWVMVLPGCVTAYNVFVCRTYLMGLPSALREAAKIDGAGDVTVCFKIYAPLALPVIATIGLFTIVKHWNSWFNALIYLNNAAKYPLQMILRKMIILDEVRGGSYADGQASTAMLSMNVHPKNVQMAAIMAAMVPILCIYPFIQKYFVKGAMIGSVKE